MSLTFTNTGTTGQCPPQDVYTLRFKSHGEVEKVTSFNDKNKTVDRIQLTFEIVGVPDDIDNYEYTEEEEAYLGNQSRSAYWMGREVKEYFSVPKDWNNEKAKLGLLWKALANKKKIELGENFVIDSFIGKDVRVMIQPKESGYPALASFSPAPQRRPATSRPAVRAAAPVEPADDEYSFPEE